MAESLWQRIRKGIGINRVTRMNQHYLAIKNELSPKGAKEKEECAYFSRKFEQYREATMRLIKFRWLVYVFLYAGFVVSFVEAIPYLSTIVSYIELGGALLGTTLLLFLLLFVTVKVNLHVELMNESLTHLIVIYQKNPKRDTTEVLNKLSETL